MSEWIRKLTEKYSDVNENQKAAMQKKLAKSAASSEKGKAAVTLPKAPWDQKNEAMDPVDQKELKGKHKDRKDKDIDNDGDVDSSDEYLHNRRKAVSKAMKKEGDVEMNPKKKDTKGSSDVAAMESTLPPVYARIIENRAQHMKGATPPMEADDGVSPNAKKMKKEMDAGKEINNDDEKGHDDVSKAGRAGPARSMRPGDNAKGDKAVINPAKDTTK